jgi:ribosomal protein S18 acetylase RimI-like enzyme
MSRQIDCGLDERTTIRRAGVEDFQTVLAVVHDATRRVQEKGFAQWRLYLTDRGIASVQARIASANGEEVYLVERAGRAIGCVSLEWQDQEYWAERGLDGKAGYTHMLAVHRDAKREGLGEKMMAWVERAIAARGREFSRLDCWAGSPYLCGYYLRLGYVAQAVHGGKNGAMLFEKRVIE